MIRHRVTCGFLLWAACLALPLCVAEEEPEVSGKSFPALWDNKLPAGNGRIGAWVEDTLDTTRVTAALLPATDDDGSFRIFREPHAMSRFLQEADSGDGVAILPPLPEPQIRLEIGWPGGETSSGFSRSIRTEDGRLISTHRRGRATIRRTILASRSGDAIFIHAISDLPGALGLRVRLLPPAPQTVEIADRRQLVSKGEGAVLSHAWVLPFESDVETGPDQSIMIRGEGEALVILNLAAAPMADGWLSKTLERLGETFDSGHWPPNPSLVWRGILERESERNP